MDEFRFVLFLSGTTCPTDTTRMYKTSKTGITRFCKTTNTGTTKIYKTSKTCTTRFCETSTTSTNTTIKKL